MECNGRPWNTWNPLEHSMKFSYEKYIISSPTVLRVRDPPYLWYPQRDIT